jgi:hypothetical protein
MRPIEASNRERKRTAARERGECVAEARALLERNPALSLRALSKRLAGPGRSERTVMTYLAGLKGGPG